LVEEGGVELEVEVGGGGVELDVLVVELDVEVKGVIELDVEVGGGGVELDVLVVELDVEVKGVVELDVEVKGVIELEGGGDAEGGVSVVLAIMRVVLSPKYSPPGNAPGPNFSTRSVTALPEPRATSNSSLERAP
jgi:hypothetical protein